MRRLAVVAHVLGGHDRGKALAGRRGQRASRAGDTCSSGTCGFRAVRIAPRAVAKQRLGRRRQRDGAPVLSPAPPAHQPGSPSSAGKPLERAVGLARRRRPELEGAEARPAARALVERHPHRGAALGARLERDLDGRVAEQALERRLRDLVAPQDALGLVGLDEACSPPSRPCPWATRARSSTPRCSPPRRECTPGHQARQAGRVAHHPPDLGRRRGHHALAPDHHHSSSTTTSERTS